jgi:hypothetical protein
VLGEHSAAPSTQFVRIGFYVRVGHTAATSPAPLDHPRALAQLDQARQGISEPLPDRLHEVISQKPSPCVLTVRLAVAMRSGATALAADKRACMIA